MMIKIKQAGLISILFLLLGTISAPSSAKETDEWKQWRVLLQKSCPDNHVDWVCGDCVPQITGAFEETLAPAEQQRLSRIRDFKDCADVAGGFSCFMDASIRAYKRVGLLRRFVAFGCQTVMCEDIALCSRLPDYQISIPDK